MGIIIAFPAASALRAGTKVASRGELAQVLILPAIRIERQTDETNNGGAPDETTAPKRGRKRRARS